MTRSAASSKRYSRSKSLDASPVPLEGIEAVFDSSPLGIVRVNLKLDITYANRALLDITGMTDWTGTNIHDIVPDEQNFARISSRFRRRRKGFSDQYEIELTRVNDGKRIPVKVAAMPVRDGSKKVVGAISIIRDISVEKAIQAFDKHLERCSSASDILREIALQAEKLIPYDYCAASVYSRDLKRARILFSYGPIVRFKSRIKWHQLGPIQRDLLEQRRVHFINDLSHYFLESGPEEARGESLKAFLQQGFRSMIRYPVFREGRLVASFAFSSTQEKAYTEQHRDVVQALPIDSALITALHYETTHDRTFRLELLRDLLECKSNKQLSGLLVKRIQAHYECANVSIFDVDEVTGTLRLNNQKAVSKRLLITPGHSQRFTEGLLGWAYTNKAIINVPNVETDERSKNVFLRAIANTVSELCIPIMIEGRVVSLLNAEDPRENAFSPEEVESLSDLVSEAGAVFERIRRDNRNRAAVASTPSAVFLVDRTGLIRSANPAAYKLLSYDVGLEGKNLLDLFQDKSLGGAFVAAQNPFSKEATLLRRDGTAVPVLIGGNQLGREFDGERIVSARDLYGHLRSEQTKFLGQMYYEIATQYKTPLSLVFGWLKNFRDTAPIFSIDLIDKSLSQLRKVELTFDRLALFDTGKPKPPLILRFLDMGEVVKTVIDELPANDRSRVTVCNGGHDNQLPLIKGDDFQISFIIRTILSYFLRCASPGTDAITVESRSQGDTVSTILEGPWATLTPTNQGRRLSDKEVARILWEMALGRETIRAFMRDHGGFSQEEALDSGRGRYILDFPLAYSEQVA
jgi:PAS domain S-box-containing protein